MFIPRRGWRIYYSGGDEGDWIIQTYPEKETVASVKEVQFGTPARLSRPIVGPKPQGWLLVHGALEVTGDMAKIG